MVDNSNLSLILSATDRTGKAFKTAIDSNNNFNKVTKIGVDQLKDYNKESLSLSKSIFGLGKGFKSSANNIEGFVQGTKSSLSNTLSLGKAAEKTGTIFDSLDEGFKGLGVRALGLKKEVASVNQTFGGTFSALTNIADASNSTERSFAVIDAVAKPAVKTLGFLSEKSKEFAGSLSNLDNIVSDAGQTIGSFTTNALTGLSKGFELAGESLKGSSLFGGFVGKQFSSMSVALDKAADSSKDFTNSLSPEHLGKIASFGDNASKSMYGFGNSLTKVAYGVRGLDIAGEFYRSGLAVKEFADNSIEHLGTTLTVLGTTLSNPMVRMILFSEKLDKASQAAGALGNVVGGMGGKFLKLASELGAAIVIGQDIALVAVAAAKAAYQLSQMSKSMEYMQALGIDTTNADLVSSLGFVGEGLLFNADAADRFGKAAVAAYAKLEDTLAFVKTLGVASKVPIDDLSDALLNLVNGPLKNSINSVAAANSMYDALSAGIGQAADGTLNLGETTQFMESALKLAAGSGTDAATTMTVLAKVQQVYGISAAKAGETASKLNSIVENGIVRFEDLTAGLSRSASVAKASGVGLDEMGGSIAALTKVMTADDAMTGYSSLLNAIAGQGAAAAKEVQELGIKFDAQSVKSKGLVASLKELYEATGGNTEQLKTIIPDSLAYATALNLMTSAAKDATLFQTKMGEATEEGLDKLFNARQESSIQRTTNLMTGFNEVLVDFGSRAQANLTVGLGPLESILEMVQSMPEPLKNAIALVITTQQVFAATTGAIGTMAIALVSVLLPIVALNLALKALTGQLGAEFNAMKTMVFVTNDYVGAAARLFGINKDRVKFDSQIISSIAQQQKAQKKLNDTMGEKVDTNNLDGYKSALQGVIEKRKELQNLNQYQKEARGGSVVDKQIAELRAAEKALNQSIKNVNASRAMAPASIGLNVSDTLKDVSKGAGERNEEVAKQLGHLVDLYGAEASKLKPKLHNIFVDLLADSEKTIKEKTVIIREELSHIIPDDISTEAATLRKNLQEGLTNALNGLDSNILSYKGKVDKSFNDLLSFTGGSAAFTAANQEAIAQGAAIANNLELGIKDRKAAIAKTFDSLIDSLPPIIKAQGPALSKALVTMLDSANGPFEMRQEAWQKKVGAIYKKFPDLINQLDDSYFNAFNNLAIAVETPLSGIKNDVQKSIEIIAGKVAEGAQTIREKAPAWRSAFEDLVSGVGEKATPVLQKQLSSLNGQLESLLTESGSIIHEKAAKIRTELEVIANDPELSTKLKAQANEIAQGIRNFIPDNVDEVIAAKLGDVKNTLEKSVSQIGSKVRELIPDSAKEEVEGKIQEIKAKIESTVASISVSGEFSTKADEVRIQVQQLNNRLLAIAGPEVAAKIDGQFQAIIQEVEKAKNKIANEQIVVPQVQGDQQRVYGPQQAPGTDLSAKATQDIDKYEKNVSNKVNETKNKFRSTFDVFTQFVDGALSNIGINSNVQSMAYFLDSATDASEELMDTSKEATVVKTAEAAATTQVTAATTASTASKGTETAATVTGTTAIEVDSAARLQNAGATGFLAAANARATLFLNTNILATNVNTSSTMLGTVAAWFATAGQTALAAGSTAAAAGMGIASIAGGILTGVLSALGAVAGVVFAPIVIVAGLAAAAIYGLVTAARALIPGFDTLFNSQNKLLEENTKLQKGFVELAAATKKGKDANIEGSDAALKYAKSLGTLKTETDKADESFLHFGESIEKAKWSAGGIPGLLVETGRALASTFNANMALAATVVSPTTKLFGIDKQELDGIVDDNQSNIDTFYNEFSEAVAEGQNRVLNEAKKQSFLLSVELSIDSKKIANSQAKGLFSSDTARAIYKKASDERRALTQKEMEDAISAETQKVQFQIKANNMVIESNKEKMKETKNPEILAEFQSQNDSLSTQNARIEEGNKLLQERIKNQQALAGIMQENDAASSNKKLNLSVEETLKKLPEEQRQAYAKTLGISYTAMKDGAIALNNQIDQVFNTTNAKQRRNVKALSAAASGLANLDKDINDPTVLLDPTAAKTRVTSYLDSINQAVASGAIDMTKAMDMTKAIEETKVTVNGVVGMAKDLLDPQAMEDFVSQLSDSYETTAKQQLQGNREKYDQIEAMRSSDTISESEALKEQAKLNNEYDFKILEAKKDKYEFLLNKEGATSQLTKDALKDVHDFERESDANRLKELKDFYAAKKEEKQKDIDFDVAMNNITNSEGIKQAAQLNIDEDNRVLELKKANYEKLKATRGENDEQTKAALASIAKFEKQMDMNRLKEVRDFYAAKFEELQAAQDNEKKAMQNEVDSAIADMDLSEKYAQLNKSMMDSQQQLFSAYTDFQDGMANQQMRLNNDITDKADAGVASAQRRIASLGIEQEFEKASLKAQQDSNKFALERESIQLELNKLEAEQNLIMVNYKLLTADSMKLKAEEKQALQLQQEALTNQIGAMGRQKQLLVEQKAQNDIINEQQQTALGYKQELAKETSKVDLQVAQNQRIIAQIQEQSDLLKSQYEKEIAIAEVRKTGADFIEKSLARQADLLSKTKQAYDDITATQQSAYSLVQSQTTSESKKRRIAQEAAEAAIEALGIKQRLEQEALILQQKQNKLATERLLIENQINKVKAEAALAVAQAEAEKVNADSSKTDLERRAAQTGVSAAREVVAATGYEGVLLESQRQGQDQQSANERQGLRNRQGLERISARGALADTTRGRADNNAVSRDALQYARGLGRQTINRPVDGEVMSYEEYRRLQLGSDKDGTAPTALSDKRSPSQSPAARAFKPPAPGSPQQPNSVTPTYTPNASGGGSEASMKQMEAAASSLSKLEELVAEIAKKDFNLNVQISSPVTVTATPGATAQTTGQDIAKKVKEATYNALDEVMKKVRSNA